jgi:acetyl esterase/lipase
MSLVPPRGALFGAGLFLAALTAVAQNAPTPAPVPAPPPAEAFYKRADVTDARLSPSGQYMAVLSTMGSRAALVVFDVLGGGKPTVAARFTDLDVYSFHWVNDDRLVFDTIDHQVAAGELRWSPGLFSVHRDGSELRMLIEIDGYYGVEERRAVKRSLSELHRLLHVPRDGGEHVIVGEFDFDTRGQPRGVIPKRLNVTTGIASLMALGAPAGANGWWFDSAGEARLVRSREGGRERFHWHAKDGRGWELLSDHAVLEAPFQPHSIDADGNLYVLQARGRAGTDVLTRYDFAARAPAAEPLASAAGFDFEGRVVSESEGGRALGLRLETDAETTVWFDPRLKALQQEADRRLPGRVNRLQCRRCDDPARMVVLVESYSDREPGEYWIYRADRQEWRSQVRQRAAIDPRRMGLRDLHRVKARDGLEIPVWVTTPAGPAAGPRPTVVLVHGGPWLRGGYWRWSADAQFLASRGYLVIEPEFRGSTGYGAAHFRAGWRQWGLAMQDDVADALKWAVDKGLADGKRSCIAGGSYGGYAALMGVVRQPELYRCAAAWMAVTDPALMFDWREGSDVAEIAKQFDQRTLVGDPQADAARLRDAAPVNQAARIKAPVLLVAAGRDRRVPLVHMTRMRDALTAAGNPPQWVIYDLEGHGWLREDSHSDFARQLERFLAQHLR